MAAATTLYKLCAKAEISETAWRNRLGWTEAYAGTPGAKFIGLSTADQLAGVAETSFAGRDDVMLMSFNVESMIEEADLKIKYEAAEAAEGGTGAFPHAYGGVIPYACLQSQPTLLPLSDGKHVFPPLGLTTAEVIANEKGEDSSEAATDDGMEPFDQHRFDEDD